MITDHEYVQRHLHSSICDACEQPEDEHHSCEQPCDPNLDCSACADYWARMVDEGFWNVEHHRWTAKGWREITK